MQSNITWKTQFYKSLRPSQSGVQYLWWRICNIQTTHTERVIYRSNLPFASSYYPILTYFKNEWDAAIILLFLILDEIAARTTFNTLWVSGAVIHNRRTKCISDNFKPRVYPLGPSRSSLSYSRFLILEVNPVLGTHAIRWREWHTILLLFSMKLQLLETSNVG